MKKILFIFFCISTSTTFLHAQNITWYNTDNECNDILHVDCLPKILGEDNDNCYTYIQAKNNNYSIEAISKVDKKIKYSKQYNANKQGHNVSIKKTLLINKKIILITEEYNTLNKTYGLYYTIYNSQTGILEEKHSQLPLNTIEQKSAEFGSLVTNIFISKNNSKILLIQQFYDQNTNLSTNYFSLLNQNLENLNTTENNSDEQDFDKDIQHILDEDGTLYFLDKKLNLISYDVENNYNKWSEKIHFNNLNLDLGSTIYDLTLKMNEKNEICLFGVYVKKQKTHDISGYVYIKIKTKSLEIISEKIIPLEPSFIKDVNDHSGKINTKPRLKVINLNNGDIILKSELSYWSNVVLNNDLILSKISSNGQLKWTIRIPKRQLFKHGYPSYLPFYSHSCFIDDENLQLLFNDHPKNNFTTQNSLNLKTMDSYKKSKISVYTISIKTGTYTTKSITRTNKDEPFLLNSLSYQKNQGSSAFLFGKNQSNYSFGIFTK